MPFERLDVWPISHRTTWWRGTQLSLGILPATRYPNPKYPDPEPKYPNPHYPISSSDSKSCYPNLYWVIRVTTPGTRTTRNRNASPEIMKSRAGRGQAFCIAVVKAQQTKLYVILNLWLCCAFTEWIEEFGGNGKKNEQTSVTVGTPNSKSQTPSSNVQASTTAHPKP
jgi:hypothetical protein